MKKLITNLMLTAIMAATFSSCSKDVLVGEGPDITESRNLPAFQQVEVSGDRTVEIVKSPDAKVDVTGHGNLVSLYDSRVSNNTLSFGYPHQTRVRKDNIRLRIHAQDLSSLKMSGNTELHIGDGFEGSQFGALLSGNGKLFMEGGSYDRVQLQTSGNARIEAETLVAREADVNVSGNAIIKVKATEHIKIRISGSGEVHYWGNPSTDIQISGDGKAVRH